MTDDQIRDYKQRYYEHFLWAASMRYPYSGVSGIQAALEEAIESQGLNVSQVLVHGLHYEVEADGDTLTLTTMLPPEFAQRWANWRWDQGSVRKATPQEWATLAPGDTYEEVFTTKGWRPPPPPDDLSAYDDWAVPR